MIVLSGEVDIVTDGTRLARLPYGSPAFKTHVGTGDMLSSLIGAFLATNDDAFDAAVDAVTTFTSAAKPSKTSDRATGTRDC